MSAKKPALGRGFDSLIPDDLLDESFDPTADKDEKMSDLRLVALDAILPDPNQPRRMFDESALEALTISIKTHGVLQPIILTPHHGGGYMIVAGERRFRASQRAGVKKIPALIRTLGDQHKLELGLIENLQREQLNVMETATAYQKLRNQFNLSVAEIGERVGGRSSSAISNTMRLLKLPHEVKEGLSKGEITEGQARPLVGLDDKLALELYPKIVQENWSARRIEDAIARYKKGEVSVKKIVREQPIVYAKAVASISKRLDSKVSIASTKRGNGTISISFRDEKDLKRIQDLLAND